ncbi:hypothetical protein [Paenibacillus amylolyticus]|uniref:hypothetical protein n=1 Tax=Paenibacillus amylolyticus TaxID=1451 RepID=UPI00201E52FE|nr:hypothetical protein [Paenibacillus amylolyticus]MCL6660898.1 hypothetical protein [Paenibacillus amylolyticus]
MEQHKKAKFDEKLKIGARILRVDQAATILPSYKKIHSQVVDFRDQASIAGLEGNSWLSKYGRDFSTNYDNVISILGERGSGKSSVLLTYKYEHTKVYVNQDIILPIIAPDQISGASDTLGWVLGFLHDEMKEVCQYYQNQQVQTNPWNWDNCNKESNNELQAKYHEIQKAYLRRQSTYAELIRKRDEGLTEQIIDNERIVNSDQRLIELVWEFISQLVEMKKKVSNSSEEPLILIFFDDVDISASRCMEVLDTIRIYLSHPNIVSFVSGAYSVFLEAVTLHMLREEKVDRESYDVDFVKEHSGIKSALTRRQERSREYLKKVFPPAYRFEMKNELSDKEKASFRYYLSENEIDKEPPTFMELLAEIKLENSNKILKNTLESQAGWLIPQVYFRLFDVTPRGIINPYYFIYMRKEEGWNGLDIVHFLEILINSNKELADAKSRILDIIRIYVNQDGTELDLDRTYIDYEKLRIYSVLSEEKLDKSTSEIKKLIETNITILLLADWFEKLLYLFGTGFKVADEIKTTILTNLLEKIYGSKILPQAGTMRDMISLYSKLPFTLLEVGHTRSFFELDTSTHYIERQYLNALGSTQGEYELLKSYYSDDPAWVQWLVNFINSVGKTNKEIINQIIAEALSEELFWDNTHYELCINYLNLKIDFEDVNTILSKFIKKVINSKERMNECDISSALQYILNCEARATVAIELEQNKIIMQDINSEIRELEQSRWLRRKEIKSSTSLINRIEKKIEALVKRWKKLTEDNDADRLFQDYFDTEELDIDRDDIEIFYSESESENTDYNYLNIFYEHLENDPVAYVYPLEVLREYLDIYTAKQLVKNENLEFISLHYDDTDEQDDLSEAQREAVKEYFLVREETKLLQLLLPKGKTTQQETLQQLNNSKEEVLKEIQILREKDDKLKKLNNEIIILLTNEAHSITKKLIEWEESKSIANRNELMIILSEEYQNNQNYTFSEYVKTIVNNKGGILWDSPPKELKKVLKDLNDLLRVFLSNHMINLSDQTNTRFLELWKELIYTANSQGDSMQMPSVVHYILTKYALELIRIKEDEKVNGSTSYFRELKRMMIIKAHNEYSAFNLYLKKALNSNGE